MENCLGGSKRTIRAQRDLQQLKQQCQQQPPNQNFYTQQQPQVHRQTVQTIKQQQQQLQQQLLQQQQQHQQQQRLLQEEQELQKVATQLLHQQQMQQQQQQQQQQLQELIQPLQQLTLKQHQLQKQLQQQQQQREIAYQLGLTESLPEHNNHAVSTPTTPKFGGGSGITNCLHFPPPPDYPPPPPKTPTSAADAHTPVTTANTKTMSTGSTTTPASTAATTPTTPVASKGNGNVGSHHHHQHQQQHQQHQQHLQYLYEEQQQQLLHEHHQQLLHEYEQQQLEEQLQQLHLPITQHYPRQQHNHHQQLTDHVLTHAEPLMAPPAVSPAAHNANVTTMNASTTNNVHNTNNHHHHNHHHHHRHHSSASSSPSTSSATSGNTIGMSPYGRRHVLPRYPDPDPDAIEVCNELEPMHTGSSKASTRHSSRTLGRHSKEHFNSSSSSSSDAKWSASSVQQTTSLQLLHQQQQHSSSHSITHSPHAQHDYSYAYYEPGAAMRHSNIPTPEMLPGSGTHNNTLHLGAAGGLGVGAGADAQPPPPNSIRALLSMGMKKKMLTSPAARHAAYQQAQKQQQQLYGFDADIACDNGASMRATNSENFYEEISSNEAALQYHYKTNQPSHHNTHLRPSGTSHSAGSLNQSLVEEELRRVHSHHHKILGELNLSVEAMLMPESPPSHSPTGCEEPTVSVTTASGKPNLSSDSVGAACGSSSLRLSTTTSANNICDASLSELLSTVGPTDELLSPVQSSTNAAFCAADLDSGFSGSSGASYIGSLRIHKTNAALSHIMSTRQTTHSPSATGGGVCSAANACHFPSAYGTQSCRSFQRSASTKQPSQQQQQQQHHQLTILDDDINAGFLARASCGRRILNCAKIRAAEDPGPVVPSETKTRSFWNSKGWRKLPGFSTSTSSINDAGRGGEPIPMRNLNGNTTTSIGGAAAAAAAAATATTLDTATRTKTKTKDTTTSTKAIPLICLKR